MVMKSDYLLLQLDYVFHISGVRSPGGIFGIPDIRAITSSGRT
jgi:hypothetical protein